MRSFVVCLASLAVVAGCGQSDFQTAKVSGRVVCDGQPVSNIVVFFEPLMTGTDALVGKQGLGRTRDDGSFQISTYGDKDGAVVGKHRVRVGWSDDFIDSSCACVVNSESDIMQVEVKKGEANEFELVLPKRTAKDQPTLDELEALEEAEDEDD
jgi:hypothetical protein